MDVADGSAISRAIKESFEWRPIDVLVCCAGIASSARVADASVEMLETVNRVNLMGTVLPVHSALPMMKARSLQHPSSIVIISSLASLVNPQPQTLQQLKLAMRIPDGLRQFRCIIATFLISE